MFALADRRTGCPLRDDVADMTVRLHPESTPDLLTMRWVTDASTTGPLPELQALVDDGTLAGVEVGTGEIRTRLEPATILGRRRRTRENRGVPPRFHAPTTPPGPVAEVLRREVSPYVDSARRPDRNRAAERRQRAHRRPSGAWALHHAPPRCATRWRTPRGGSRDP